MLNSVKTMFLLVFVVLIASCSVNQKCDCHIPGPALVKVFIAEDGIPNVNINTVDVYPGQELVYEGLDEFSLTFARDPQDPENRNKTYKSKKGKIILRISKIYDDILKDRRSQKGYEIIRNEDSSTDKDASAYLYIKYDVTANGKTRDPGLKIFPK